MPNPGKRKRTVSFRAKGRPVRFIAKAIKRPGAFRRKAERRDLTTKQFTRKVLANPGRFDDRTLKQARLAKTLAKLRMRR